MHKSKCPLYFDDLFGLSKKGNKKVNLLLSVPFEVRKIERIQILHSNHSLLHQNIRLSVLLYR